MDSKSMYIIMQNVIQTHDFSYFYMQRLHRFTCVDLQSWQGGFLQITITPSHVLKYESNYRLQTGLYQDGWIKYPRFLLQTLPSLSLFLQCSYSPSTSSVFHYLLTSLLFPPYLFNLFFPSLLFVSLRFLHVDKALVSLFRCRMFWLLRRTTEYFVTALENMDMKHVFPV